MTLVSVAIAVVAAGLATVRWARVAQREHYIAGSVVRFAGRWWLHRPPNALLAGVAIVAVAGSVAWGPLGIIASAVVGIGPVGLGLRGRTSPLRWTPRLRRLVTIAAVVEGVAFLVATVTGAAEVATPLVALLVPLWVDVALAIGTPLERSLSERFVTQAGDTLRRVAPRVVAITGSYGKTSTKEHVRDLVSGTFEVVASPASFNNRLGLAKAINDSLTPGVEVFVAEMGTFAKGEIAALVKWIEPTVSVLTAVGPVHLERFGSLEAIARAKSEIFARAEAAVINADDERVVGVAPSAGRAVFRCSARESSADVVARVTSAGVEVSIRGDVAGTAPAGLFPMNVACAAGAALALGVPVEAIGARLANLSPPAHRAQVTTAPSGVTVIDDTYNSNPEGAAAALALVRRAAGNGSAKRVVVTPGMIELGGRQSAENTTFGAAAADVATHVVVVGHSNRPALLAGARRGGAEVVTVADREAASRYVRSIVGAGDVVLYENDLPDHHP